MFDKNKHKETAAGDHLLVSTKRTAQELEADNRLRQVSAAYELGEATFEQLDFETDWADLQHDLARQEAKTAEKKLHPKTRGNVVRRMARRVLRT